MKRTIALGLTIIWSIGIVQGQILKEWLHQKKTQKEYLLTQILANQLYLELLDKGYRIFRTGMGIVAQWKQGEFSLHQTFFESLGLLRPAVRRFGKIAESTAMLLHITAKYRQLNKDLQDPSLLPEEKQYAQATLEGILKKSLATFEQLLDLLDKSLDLEDQQRLSRLQQIHGQMQEYLIMMREVAQSMEYLKNNREKELRQTSEMQRLQQKPPSR